MTKEKKIITAMTIILILLIAIFSYFLINKNVIIKEQAEKIELQAMETNGSNSYITTQEHLNELSSKKAYIINQVMCESSSMQGGIGTTTFYIDVKRGEKINFGDISIIKTYGNNVYGNWAVYATLNGNIIYGISTLSNDVSFETETIVRKAAQVVIEEDGVLIIKLQARRNSPTGGTEVKVNGISIEK